MLLECLGSGADRLERQAGTLGNREQVGVAVGEAQQPQVRELRVRPVGHALVEAALAELRLAVRREIAVARIRLEQVDDRERGRERRARARRRSRASGRPPRSGTRGRGRGAFATACRRGGRIRANRIAVRRRRSAASRRRCSPARARATYARCAVDRRVAAPASLVAQRPRIADAGDDEPVPDAVERVAVAIEPAERAERARAPQQAEGMCQRLLGQRLRERPEQHDAGEVVVGERRMAHVRGEQELGVASRRGG